MGNCTPGPDDKYKIISPQIIAGIKYFKFLTSAFKDIDANKFYFGGLTPNLFHLLLND